MDLLINGANPFAPVCIAKILRHRLNQMNATEKETIIVCIGTDRITGDCLGPLVGDKLTHLCSNIGGVRIYGTLDQPVHAGNLQEIHAKIQKRHPDSLILAVDASLGNKKHLGYITIGDGCLYPGAGVRKNLPGIGNLHITGIVNTGGFLDLLMLQTTRLSRVRFLADTITSGIWKLLTAESCPPAPVTASPHQYIPDLRQQELRWLSG